MTTTAVSVCRMGSSMLPTLGRRPVVTPGMGRLGSSDVVDLLAWIMRPHRMAASYTGRLAVVCCRGAGGSIDHWCGLGDQPGGDHARSTSVVGHVGLGGVSPSALGWERFILCCGVVRHLMKSNLASGVRLSSTIRLTLRLAITNFLVIFRSSGHGKSMFAAHSAETRVDSLARRLLLCSSPAMASNPLTNHHRCPSLPGTRLEIRQGGFHIHSRHLLAKQMIQFKSALIHGP